MRLEAKFLAAFAVVAFLPAAVTAQLNRSAVSVNGVDTNPCTPAAPCRTFAQALSQTNSGGEVIALDSGGYGSILVDKSVSIQAAPGVYAGITTGGNGVAVNLPSPGKVVLRGLSLEGLGNLGGDGIAFVGGGGRLHIENCTVSGFRGVNNAGIVTFFDTTISNTIIRNCHLAIRIDNAGAPLKAVLDSVRVKNVNNGVFVDRNATVTIRNSMVVNSNNYGFGSGDASSSVNLENCAAANINIAGIQSSNNSTVRASNCLVTDSTVGMRANYGGLLETWGNNKVRGNGTDLDNTTPVPGTITTVPMD